MKLLSHIRTLSSTPLLPQKQEPNSLLPSFPPTRVITYRLRRRHLALLIVGVASLGLAVVQLTRPMDPARLNGYPNLSASLDVDETIANFTNAAVVAQDGSSRNNATALNHSPLLLGPPTQRFRENLRSDRKYITSWYGAGWNNDVITMMNLIYLAKITDRIPVIPTFTPSWHIGGDAPGIAFGEIFDIPRFVEETRTEVLEWRDVKDPRSQEVEELGCWSVWQAVQKDEDHPRDSDAPKWLNLDIAYTKAPEWIQMLPDNVHDKGASFWSLARLAYPYDRQLSLRDDVLPSPLHGAVVNPDEHLLCYDYLYYVGSHQWFEFEYEYGPAWREIGRHLHWTEDIETLAVQYVNRALGLPVGHSAPPYITVHVRHGDFAEWCWDGFEDCFAPLSAIARRVQEVRDEILERHGISIPMKHVIMTSDETDEAWWDQVASYGWKRIDHAGQRTAERYSRWHPLVLDSVIQSNGLGFVGTDRSTFSILSRRRVTDWHGGSTRMVLWGKKGADDH